MKLISSIVSKFIYGVCALVLLCVASFFLLPHVPGFGTLDIKIVKSGSMEPNIMTGGIVLIREAPAYNIGDIITFKGSGSDVPTTHRIVGTEVVGGKTFFVSKGDANEERDNDLVAPRTILGKVLFTAPYVGFLLDFSRKPLGFALLIGVPALLIVIDEIEKIWRAFRGLKKKNIVVAREKKETPAVVKDPFEPLVIPARRERERVMIHDIVAPRSKKQEVAREEVTLNRYMERAPRLASGALTVLLVGTMLISSTFAVGDTFSYARDTEKSEENFFKTPAVDFILDANKTLFTIDDGTIDGGDAEVLISQFLVNNSVPLAYRIDAEMTGGDVTLCDSILASSSVPFTYDGLLKTIESPSSVMFVGPWQLSLSLQSEPTFVSGTACDITIRFTGWDAELTEGTSRYFDEEFVTLSFMVVDLFAPRAPEAFSFGASEALAPQDESNGGGDSEGSGTTTEPVVEGEVASTTDESTEDGSSQPSEPVLPVEPTEGTPPSEEVVEETTPAIPTEPEVVDEPVVEEPTPVEETPAPTTTE